MSRLIGLIVMVAALLSGCEHIPSEIYEIKTVDGRVIKLYCPTVERGRSTFTYVIDNECRLVND